MADNQLLKISNIDFNQIKESLKDFLRSKPNMADYDFEASGFAYLLDLLAYNTAYNAFYLNMACSEMFLDSAQLRSDIVSKAKLLGYLPSSMMSARSTIRVDFTPDPSKPLPQQIFIDKETIFMGEGTDGTSYQFIVAEPQTLYYANPSGAPSDYDTTTGKFFSEFDIIEGIRLTQRTLVTPDANQRFTIPNADVDVSTIKVWVQKSTTNLGLTPFVYANDITELTSDSKVFYLQYTENNLCEVYFGDGVISAGFQTNSLGEISSNGLEPGNVVVIEYIVSQGGINANGIKQFTAAGGIGRADPPTSGITVETIQTMTQASGGNDPESDKSIKYFAPINYEMQNRAVTELDFEQTILRKYPRIDSIAVWGGEENVPPQWGKVFVSIKPSEGYVLNNENKDAIVNDIIRPRCVVTQDPVIVDPDYLYLIISSDVKFDFRNSIKRKQEIQYAVYQTILNYSETVLERFGRGFVYSDLVTRIDDTDAGIYSNLSSVSLKKIIYPTLGIKETFELIFANQIDNTNIKKNIYGKSIYSSAFYYLVGSSIVPCIFAEDSLESDILTMFYINQDNTLTKVKEMGTINSQSGTIKINELFTPTSWIGNMNHVEFYVTPFVYDIDSARNLILVIDGQDIKVSVEDKAL
jgi:hypothetical protein